MGNRPDLSAIEEAEKAVLLTYLPQQLSRKEITIVVKRIILGIGLDKRKIMPIIMNELKGKAPGALINIIVTEILAQEK